MRSALQSCQHCACIRIFHARRGLELQQVVEQPIVRKYSAFASLVSAINTPPPLMKCHRPIIVTPAGGGAPFSWNRCSAAKIEPLGILSSP